MPLTTVRARIVGIYVPFFVYLESYLYAVRLATEAALGLSLSQLMVPAPLAFKAPE